MRPLLRVLVALALLAGGLAVLLAALFALAAALGSIPSADNVAAVLGFTTYYRVVLVKGLAPQLLVCAGLLALLQRRAPAALASRAALPGAALVAFAPAAWLLARPLGERLPALQMRGAGELAMSAVLMSAAVILAWAAAARLVRAPSAAADPLARDA